MRGLEYKPWSPCRSLQTKSEGENALMSTNFIYPNLKRQKQKQTIQLFCACINSGYLRPQASLEKHRKLTRQSEHNTVYTHTTLRGSGLLLTRSNYSEPKCMTRSSTPLVLSHFYPQKSRRMEGFSYSWKIKNYAETCLSPFGLL